jgi:myosin heavy subunit
MFGKKKQDAERKPIEQEIAELQKKFRVLENDKRAYSEDSQAIIRKQRATIEKLTRENRQMKQDLNETRAVAASRSESKSTAKTLQTIQENKEHVERQLQLEYERRNDIAARLEELRASTTEVRKDLCKRGGVNAASENTEAIAKQIRVLENRLDKSLQKFNEAIAYNKSLRENIDGLRRERVVFDSIYKKLEQELQVKKKEMANIIEQANAAYEARDQAQAQMAALKQQADKEHQEFEREWKELGKLIENDKKMKEFMKQKERHKMLEEQEGDMNQEEEGRMKKKVTKSAWNVAKDKASMHMNLEKVQVYEEAFAKMQAATGISDIDELVENFIAAEDQNFSLFTYANELSGDIEKHEGDISDLKSQLEFLKGTGGGQMNAEKKKMFVELEEKWSKIDKMAEHYELKYQHASKTLTAVRAGIQSVFNRLHSKSFGPPDMSAVSESNMTQYLGVIEGRISEILNAHNAMQQQDGEEEEPAAPPQRPPGGTQVQIKLPSTVEDYSDDEEEDDEDDQRPFTREELKLKTIRGIQKKQEKSKKAGRRPN